jgi:opacity protein-like surface antigen
MKKFLLGGVALLAMLAGGQARAADLPVKAPIAIPVWDWTGFYIGAHSGLAFGYTVVDDPFGGSIFGDNVRTPGYIFGGQIGYNWQIPGSGIVVGWEADASWIASDPGGTNTCLAFSGNFVSYNCLVKKDATATFAGRVGGLIDPARHTLLYGKVGVAVVHDEVSVSTNAPFFLAPQTVAGNWTQVGGDIGIGVEHALTPAWSFKAEYDFLFFRQHDISFPPSLQFNTRTLVPTAAGTTTANQDVHEFKIGLNYHWGHALTETWPTALPAYPVKAKALPVAGWAPGWEFEFGGRYWGSTGRFQKDLGNVGNPPTNLNSRLTYVTDDNSGEIFGRIDSPWNFFVKGFAGGGSAWRGHMNDEDWILAANVPYSNTISDPVKSTISYYTFDVGYDFWRGPGYKVGGFIGYNYYKENKDAYGCVQIANQNSDCVPPIPNTVLGITENDTWKSARIGTVGEVMLMDRVKLTAEAAYLPYVKFDGVDNHVLRNIVSPETGKGQGVQVEALLSYYLTQGFSVGVGGRYWAMWTDQNAYTNFGGGACPAACPALPSKTERYGFFLQGAYKFDGPGSPIVARY